MPYLMVNLDDNQDIRRAMAHLRQVTGRGGKGRGAVTDSAEDSATRGGGPAVDELAGLPLPQKLKRIRQRQLWKHLVRIAESGGTPCSLPELDTLLDLPKNKMRSLKANMAKLENRFGVKFLRVAPDAGVDVAGNPRYEMPPNMRRQIRKLAEAQ